jgi:LCP family protein required for cell wall assembly
MDERPPRLARRMLLRAALATFLIVGLSASAVAWSVINEIEQILPDTLPRIEGLDPPTGGARTFMILGTDERLGADRDSPPRSDTLLLVRADPDEDTIRVMSVPRDLWVEIPGHGKDKINAAYELGGRNGAQLVVRTVKQLFEDATGERFPVTNVMVVDYAGFRRAVDYIGGVYIDVDRDYFNDNSTGTNFATIDVDPGYQRLMGRDALDYVRYRHGDNDFVRAARQQDFLRQAQGADGVRSLFSIGDRGRLSRIFQRFIRVDETFRSTKQIFSLLRLGLHFVQEQPRVGEVPFRVREAPNPQVDSRLFQRRAWVRQAHRRFMALDSPAAQRPARRASERRAEPAGGLEPTSEGDGMAVLADPRLDFPFYFPTERVTGSRYPAAEPRVYRLKDEQGARHQAYRLVLEAPGIGEFYGVQGMTWQDPPILDDPDRTVRHGGRRFELLYDGRRLRRVAWRTKRAVYWVSNTLTGSIGERQLLAIAGSLQRLRA